MLRFLWTPEIIEHIARHGITPDEFEQAVRAPAFKGWSTTNPDLEYIRGYTDENRYLGCVYDTEDDGMTIIPVTAFPLQHRQ